MSRFEVHKDDSGCIAAYGLDAVMGWFYQEFDSDGECILDEDSMYSGLSKGRLVALLCKTDAPEAHIKRIALDLDPERSGNGIC